MENILSVSSNTFHGFPVEDALETIAYAGFNNVELTAVKNWTEHIMPDWPENRQEMIINKMKNLGLSCPVLSGHCNLVHENRLDDFKKNIKLAHKLGCKYIVSSIDEAHYDMGDSMNICSLINNIRSLVPYLEESNVQLGIELHGAFGSGEALKPLLEEINEHKWIGITYDTGNAVYFGRRNPEIDVKCCLENLKTVHLKDKTGPDQIGIYPPLGEGKINIPAFMNEILNAGFKGPISIEIEFDADFARKIKTDSDRDFVMDALIKSRKYLESIAVL